MFFRLSIVFTYELFWLHMQLNFVFVSCFVGIVLYILLITFFVVLLVYVRNVTSTNNIVSKALFRFAGGHIPKKKVMRFELDCTLLCICGSLLLSSG